MPQSADFSCDRAMVREHRSQRTARQSDRRDRQSEMVSRMVARSDPQHDGDAPRLVHLAPARVGRADSRGQMRGMRRGRAAACDDGSSRGNFRARRFRRMVQPAGGGLRRARPQVREVRRRGFYQGRRHPRRVVRFGLLASRGAWRAPGTEVAGGRVPGSGRAGARMVRLVAGLRGIGARHGAVQERNQPWTDGGRAGPQDVQVARQLGGRRRCGRTDGRRRAAAGVRVARLHGRHHARPDDFQRGVGVVSQDSQHLPVRAGQPGGLRSRARRG